MRNQARTNWDQLEVEVESSLSSPLASLTKQAAFGYITIMLTHVSAGVTVSPRVWDGNKEKVLSFSYIM